MNKQLCIELDQFLVADLERERSLLGDDNVASILVRRIERGIDLLSGDDAALLDWRPLHRARQAITIEVSAELTTGLSAAANSIGYEERVVLAAFARSEACKPFELREVEFRYWADGRGDIYRASFEMRDYQLAFVTLLARPGWSRSAVIGEALLALAQEVCATNALRNVPISDEARAFAGRMISLSGRRPSLRSETRNWSPRIR